MSQPAVYKEIVKFQKKIDSEYQCKILRMSAEKVWIESAEKTIRQTLFKIIKNEMQKGIKLYKQLLQALLYNGFEQKEYEWMVKLVKEYFDSRYIQISDANLYMIVSAVYITMIRNYQSYKVLAPVEKKVFSPEIQGFFEYLKEQGFELSDDDLEIIGELLYGFKMTANPVNESTIDSFSVLILEDFCNEVMEKYHFDLWQSPDFYENMLIHIEYLKSQLNIPVASVEPRIYAMADGEKALDFAISLLEG